MSLTRKSTIKWRHERLTRTKTIEEEIEHSGEPARNRRQHPTVVGTGRVGVGVHLHHNNCTGPCPVASTIPYQRGTYIFEMTSTEIIRLQFSDVDQSIRTA